MSDTQFFHTGDVHRWIYRLASARRLTIFAGAGLTIDKTGLGWAGLIQEALSQNRGLETKGFIDPAGARLVAAYLQPVEAATIAEHYYGMLFDNANDGRTPLLQAIQGLLYPGAYWQTGYLTETVLNMATSLASTFVDVQIVTTNYETHIEDQYLAMATKARKLRDHAFPGLSVRILNEELAHHKGSADVPDIELVYLHGRIPNQGQIDGDVALSEHDYYRLRAPVTDALREAFTDREVVIVGASLTDPPLLAALEQTHDSTESRVALTALPSYRFHNQLGHHDVDVLKDHLRARMEEFGVELLFPDFYYQVAQFFDEVRIARVLANVDHYSEGSGEIRYGGRLTSWWQDWERTHLNISDPAIRAHKAVRKALGEIVEILKPRTGVRGTESEPFKLNVWARWNPTEDSRCIAPWASSDSVNRDVHNPRTRDLDSLSDLYAMQAFVRGRPILMIGDGAYALHPAG